MSGDKAPPIDLSPSFNWGMWEVLIGAASIALSTVAILVAIAGVGIYIYGKEALEKTVEQEVQKRLEEQEKELRGRLVGYVGFIFGRLRVVREDFIGSAIHYSQTAYEFLPETSKYRMAALNNLAFYYSVRGYSTDAPAAVRYAQVLLESYAESQNIEWLTTYANVVSTYHSHFDNPKRALSEAERMMEEINTRDDTTTQQKQNAARHLEKIRAALAKEQ